MKILVACEESQRVCAAFRERGHEAYSCDILEPSGGHPEWHIQDDALEIIELNNYIAENPGETVVFFTLDGNLHAFYKPFDMMVAFPPCTHLAVSGAAWFEEKRRDGRQREGIEFFCKILNANIEKICVENPVGIIGGDYVSKWFPDLCEKYNLPIKPTQKIHPWMFGDNYSKTTCLWLKNIPALTPKVKKQPDLEWFYWVDSKTGKIKRQPKWFYDAFSLSPEERAKIRSKTFPGIAKAMAEQWG